MIQNKQTTHAVARTTIPATDFKTCALWFLFAVGSVIAPHIPDYIDRLIDLPSQVMAGGYGCYVKKGDFELKFGADIFQSADDGEEVQNDVD